MVTGVAETMMLPTNVPRVMPQASAPQLLTVAEAAAEARVSKDTIWRHIEKGALKVKRVGPFKRIRISRVAFDRYMGT